MSEEWDCPTCGRQVPPAMDYECSTCEMPASHHVPVTELCKRIRALQAREASLIVRNKKLEDDVNEQARLLGMSGERECDLRGEMERLERERDAALIGYNECRATIEDARVALNAHEYEGLLLASLRIQDQLTSERDLADRLAEAANAVIDQWETPNWKLTEPTATCIHALRNTLAAWKEARND